MAVKTIFFPRQLSHIAFKCIKRIRNSLQLLIIILPGVIRILNKIINIQGLFHSSLLFLDVPAGFNPFIDRSIRFCGDHPHIAYLLCAIYFSLQAHHLNGSWLYSPFFCHFTYRNVTFNQLFFLFVLLTKIHFLILCAYAKKSIVFS